MAQAEEFTLGVEEEFQIIDPQTRELSADAEAIFPIAQATLGDAVKLEMILSQIEIASPVCRTLAEIEAALTHLRKGMIDAAAEVGKQIGAAATHPFSAWQEQPVTPRARYESLILDFQQLTRRQLIFGCHVHVGLSDHETAIRVMNRARVWLPILLALSASSPFWFGEDTEYASFRTGLWWASPLSGPPPLFSSKEEYDKLLRAFVTTKSIRDITRIYWDIRLPERFNTIEFRVMDVCMTIEESVMLVGLVRALVRTCYEQTLGSETYPRIDSELVRAANWRAARYGLDGELVDLAEERTVPAHELIEKFLAFVRPALEAEGDWERISSSVSRVMQYGNGATRQREAFKRTGRIEDVVDFIVAETARGIE